MEEENKQIEVLNILTENRKNNKLLNDQLKKCIKDIIWKEDIIYQYNWIVPWPNQSINDAIWASYYRPDEFMHNYLLEFNMIDSLCNKEIQNKTLESARFGDWLSISIYHDLVHMDYSIDEGYDYNIIIEENLIISNIPHIALAYAMLAMRIGLDSNIYLNNIPDTYIFKYLRYFDNSNSNTRKEGLKKFINTNSHTTPSILCDSDLAKLNLALMIKDNLEMYNALMCIPNVGEAWYFAAQASHRLKGKGVSHTYIQCLKRAAELNCHTATKRLKSYYKNK